MSELNPRMAELLIRGLVFLGLIVAGWFLSKHRSDLARKIVRTLPIIAGILVGCLAVTGYLRTRGPGSLGHSAAAHWWAGHGIVTFLWLAVPLGIGVLLQTYSQLRILVTILQFVAFLTVLAIVLVAAISGYLGPTYPPPLSEEAHKRFEILHEYLLPDILVVLLVEWWWFFRPQGSSSLPSN